MGRLEEQDFDEKRLLRRNRRKKSQLTAYIILGIIILVIASGVFFGVYSIRNLLKNMKSSEPSAAEASTEATEVVIETPESVTEEPQEMSDEDVLDEIVNGCIQDMPIEDKVAGLFIVTPEQLTGVETAVKAGSGTQEALSQYAVGGIVYFPKNIKSADQIKEMLDTTTSMSKYPIFTMVSEDGTSGASLTKTIGVEGVTDVTDSDSAFNTASAISSGMFKYGFNFDLAPKVDLSDKGTYGTDPDQVKDIVSSFVTGLQAEGVDACITSFPLYTDTKAGLTTVDKSKEDLAAAEYVVFKDAIDISSVSAVMLSNASFPSVAGDNTPASLSSVMIEDELRSNLGYKGIVITGPLDESSVVEYYTSEEAAVKAVKAGADMIYIPEDFKAAYDGLLAAVQSGEISEDRIDESLKRIYRVKYAKKVDEITKSD